MPVTSTLLKNIVAEARPIIERQLNDAKLIAGFRDLVTANGGDWSALKALIKAHVEDENDETGNGKRVRKILDKADSSTAYADMLGLANMNEKNFSQEEFDAETGEVINPYAAAQAGEKQSPDGKASGSGHLSAIRNGAITEQSDVDSSATARTPDGDAQTEKHHNENASLAAREGEQVAAPIPEAFNQPAFLIRDKGPLRPHCLDRANCGSGFPREHCHACKRAMEASEVAA